MDTEIIDNVTSEATVQDPSVAETVEPTSIEVDTKELKQALTVLNAFTNQRGRRVRLPILEGVYLACHADGVLVCRRTDLDVFAEVVIPAVLDQPDRSNWKRIEGDPVRSEWIGPLGTAWQALVSLDALKTAVKSISAPRVGLELVPGACTVKSPHGKMRLATLPLEEYPNWLGDAGSAVYAQLGVPLTVAEMHRLGRTTFAAASRDTARPVFENLHLETRNGAVEAACADSWRLAVQQVTPASGPALDGFECLFPAYLFSAVLRHLPKEGVVYWTLQDNTGSDVPERRILAMTTPTFRIWTRVSLDKYANYRAVMTMQDRTVASVNRQVLQDGVRSAQAVAAASGNVLYVVFAQKAEDPNPQNWYLTLRAGTDDTAFETTFPQPVDVSLQGDSENDALCTGTFEVIVNCEYLRSGLAAMTGQTATFRFANATAMFNLLDSADPDWSYYVMPMHKTAREATKRAGAA